MNPTISCVVCATPLVLQDHVQLEPDLVYVCSFGCARKHISILLDESRRLKKLGV